MHLQFLFPMFHDLYPKDSESQGYCRGQNGNGAFTVLLPNADTTGKNTDFKADNKS